MHVGVDSFVSAVTDPKTGREVGPEERIEHLLEEIALADTSGLYSFGIGEHHREEYYDSAPPVILGAAAARTSRIRLGSAVTVLSAADPVRVFQQFATLDLVSKGRADLIVGRGSFVEAFPLFGLDLDDYDTLFSEKLDLLLQIREPRAVLGQIRNAGSIFLGEWSPEPLGDYCSGTNHVLPTYGYARAYSGLSLMDFSKRITVQELTPEGLRELGPVAATLAHLEGLDAHAAAVERRLVALEQRS